MTVQEFQAGAIERAAATLAHFLDTTITDKQDWTPSVDGGAGLRSALDQVAECILVNRALAALITDGQPITVSPLSTPERPFTDTEDAKAQLVASAATLAEAIRGMSDADLARDYPARRGTAPGYILIEMPLRNMHYHSGQINLIQLCYGDTEFRPAPMPQKAP